MAMFENISEFFKRFMQNDKKELLAENPSSQSKETAKDRLHVVLMQDRANVSADFLEMMKEEIIEVIKKYIIVDETKIDVRLTNEENEDGSIGVPLLHANIPILNVRNDLKSSYMNGFSSEKIEGQEEINLESDKTQIIDTIKVTESEEKVENEEKIEENDEVSGSQSEDKIEEQIEDKQEYIVDENKLVENDQENVSEENSFSTQNKDVLEMKIDEIVDNDLDDDELEDDDDVTFDDLLKAAEEEEKRLKNKEENKEENKIDKKKSTPKKKKTSKKYKK